MKRIIISIAGLIIASPVAAADFCLIGNTGNTVQCFPTLETCQDYLNDYGAGHACTLRSAPSQSNAADPFGSFTRGQMDRARTQPAPATNPPTNQSKAKKSNGLNLKQGQWEFSYERREKGELTYSNSNPLCVSKALSNISATDWIKSFVGSMYCRATITGQTNDSVEYAITNCTGENYVVGGIMSFTYVSRSKFTHEGNMLVLDADGIPSAAQDLIEVTRTGERCE